MNMRAEAPNGVTDSRFALVEKAFRDSMETKRRIVESHIGEIVAIADCCLAGIRAGGKLMFCGNGGSAADAQHLAAELLVRLRSDLNRGPLPALALALDTSSLTACGNDYEYEAYYGRMVRALGRKEDVLIAISTSGRSSNILLALEAARAMGIGTVGLLGGDGGAAARLCDHAFVVPSGNTARIQESHITAGHTIMELIEDTLMAEGLLERAD